MIKSVIFMLLSLSVAVASLFPTSGVLAPSSSHFRFLCTCALCAVLAACGFAAFATFVFSLDIQSLVCPMNELNRSPRHPPHTKTPIAFALGSGTPARASSCFHEFPPVFPAAILVFPSVLSSCDILWPLSCLLFPSLSSSASQTRPEACLVAVPMSSHVDHRN